MRHNSEDIFLSVIIPCYNVQDYISSCITSLGHQNKTIPVEFIFINDGSTDNTLKCLLKFQHIDSRVLVINKLNEGVSSARNDALKVAKGEYVYFLDGDDYISDNALSVIYDSLREGEEDMLITNLVYKEKNKEVNYNNGILPGNYTPKQLYESSQIFPTPPQNIYKNAIIKRNNISFDSKLKVGEVYDFTVKFLQYANKIKVINNPIYYYVMHDQSATHKPNYPSDITVINTINSLYYTDADFGKIISFHLTAFKIATSFTYNKYVLNGLDTKESRFVVKSLLSNRLFKQITRKIILNNHKCIKERLLAIYIQLSGLLGFRILIRIKR